MLITILGLFLAFASIACMIILWKDKPSNCLPEFYFAYLIPITTLLFAFIVIFMVPK